MHLICNNNNPVGVHDEFSQNHILCFPYELLEILKRLKGTEIKQGLRLIIHVLFNYYHRICILWKNPEKKASLKNPLLKNPLFKNPWFIPI